MQVLAKTALFAVSAFKHLLLEFFSLDHFCFQVSGALLPAVFELLGRGSKLLFDFVMPRDICHRANETERFARIAS